MYYSADVFAIELAPELFSQVTRIKNREELTAFSASNLSSENPSHFFADFVLHTSLYFSYLPVLL
jgi:hypothetical protein